MHNKNSVDNQEVSIEEKNFKSKLFNYFFLMICDKKPSLIVLYALHILEIFQLISFAFSSPHTLAWKIPLKSLKILTMVTGAFRLAPLVYLSNRVFSIIFFFLFIMTFFLFILIMVQILVQKPNSKIHKSFLRFIIIMISPLTIFFFIPIIEIFLSPLKCLTLKSIHQCFNNIQILFFIIGIICTLILLFILILLNYLYFYPIQDENMTVKLNSDIDLFLLIIKLLYTLRLLFIKDEYISVVILLLFYCFLTFKQIKNPIYNINSLELLLNIRNFVVIWTYFMILVAKFCEETKVNGLIYLLFAGYPIIIFCSIAFFKQNETEFHFQKSNYNNISSCLSKARFLINLVNTFIENKNHNNLKDYEMRNRKNDILLKGLIKLHIETCLREDCPLTKFIENDENFNVQKQCLLNYMSIFFNNAMKIFPDNTLLKLYYINFNFYKKYNLNSVRANLEEIKKMKSDLKEEFVVYVLDNVISKMKIKDVNEGNEKDKEIVLIEQNYKKLKDLISNCTKLYVEFWGIFATNITNNLNTTKLYKLGEKINHYLKEIFNLWDKYLKNKKIDIENENIAQLYSRFLREILWAKNKSEEIQKKINEEHQFQGFKKSNDENQQIDNYEINLENQDYIIFVNSNDKGKCTISQYSNSLIYLIGYQRQEIINKPLEILMPSMFIEGHSKKVEEFIKTMHFQKSLGKDSFHGVEKKRTFILIKNKMGYLTPFNAKFTIFDDNDFSNSFLIKAQLEFNDIKSLYAYYILANPDFNIESISSSAIHLGLTMDLLKKYVIKLNVLVRTHKDNILNLYEKYKYFKEDQKKVIWVFPDVVYPKNDDGKNKGTPIQDLIKVSEKKKFYLQIIEMKYNENEIIGYVFKFMEIQKNKKNKTEIIPQEFKPSFKNEVLFDLLSLRYIRTITVDKKSGFRNLREKEDDNESKDLISNNSFVKKRKTKKRIIEEESSGDENAQMILTKEKILELQTKDSLGIKTFINLLPFYGNEIGLIKHRPNREKYPAGKAQEPLIKIDVSNFTRRIDSKLKENPEFYKKFKNSQTENRGVSQNENKKLNLDYISSSSNNDEINKKRNEEINKDFIGNTSSSLMNFFNIKSTKTIKYIDFFIYFFIITISTISLIVCYNNLNDNGKRFSYVSKTHRMLSHICYIKYFVLEASIINSTVYNNSLIQEKSKYISYLKEELKFYRGELSEIFEIFSSKEISFSDEYNNFLSHTIINIVTLSNGNKIIEQQPFLISLTKLTTALFYISTMGENEIINMTNKYTNELMYNLLNEYFIYFSKLITIVSNDFRSKTKGYGISSIIIFLISIAVSLIYIIIFWKMMTKLDNDREKPINLFLTIKKKVFEDLKNSAESFSNKLLNKFFGNEEIEEESQQEYKANIKSNDINIAKFKALNEYKASIKKKSSFLFYFIQIILLFVIFNLYLLFIYINSSIYAKKVGKYINIYSETVYSHLYLIARIAVIKQYFFNDTIPSFTLPNTISSFEFCFKFTSLQFGQAIQTISQKDSFMNEEVRALYNKYLFNDYFEIIKNNTNLEIYNEYCKQIGIPNNLINYSNKTKNGFMETLLEAYEIMRFLSVRNYINDTRTEYTSDLIYDDKWFDLNEIIIYLIRPWYDNLIKALENPLYMLAKERKLNYLLLYLAFILLISIYYWSIWKRYEENFIYMIKKSFDLINLIPEEIKGIIVSKLNE